MKNTLIHLEYIGLMRKYKLENYFLLPYDASYIKSYISARTEEDVVKLIDSKNEWITEDIEFIGSMLLGLYLFKNAIEPLINKDIHTWASIHNKLVYTDECGEYQDDSFLKKVYVYFEDELKDQLFEFIVKNKKIVNEFNVSDFDVSISIDIDLELILAGYINKQAEYEFLTSARQDIKVTSGINTYDSCAATQLRSEAEEIAEIIRSSDRKTESNVIYINMETYRGDLNGRKELELEMVKNARFHLSFLEYILNNGLDKIMPYWFNKSDSFEEYISVRSLNDIISLFNKNNQVVAVGKSSLRVYLIRWLLFLNIAQPLLDKHIDVLIGKQKRLVYIDEYGDAQFGRYYKELNVYFKDKLNEEMHNFIDVNIKYIREILPCYIDAYSLIEDSGYLDDIITDISNYIDIASEKRSEINAQGDSLADPNMTGHDYEYYIASRVNNETGWAAEVTSGSGDQGADLVIYKNNSVAVVQLKYYSSSVGNSAVQEAFSAKTYYNANTSFVVTNSYFTASAISLAEKTNVYLMQEEDFILHLNSV